MSSALRMSQRAGDADVLNERCVAIAGVPSRKRSDGVQVHGEDALRGTVKDRTSVSLHGISKSQNRRRTSSRTILE